MSRAVRQYTALPVAQRGAVVLILLIIIAASTATYFLVHELNNTRLQVERDKINAAALAQARDAVLGFALANNEMPGGLPFPDRRRDGDYDGNGDCVTNSFNKSHLLGKFPFLNEEGCGDIRAFDINPIDSSGERLWYAASSKLVKSKAGGNYQNITTAELMADGDWLTVNDENGAVLSDKVAFVLISPGGTLQGQNRSGNAPSARRFLDDFKVGATTYKNWDDNLAFIAARPVNNASNRFNDRLLYVTRDEFVNRLVLRIVGDVRSHLDQYHGDINHTQYPYAATLAEGECIPTLSTGYLPFVDVDNNCGGPLDAFPPWWDPPLIPNTWQDITHYTRLSADQATVQFDSCASTFTITWNSETRRDRPC